MATICVGLQTSKDSAYIFEPNGEEGGVFIFDDLTGKRSKVEKSLCRPCLLDAELEAYGTPTTSKRIIFPYRFLDEKPVLITPSELESKYPHAYAYFLSVKDILDKRAVSPKRSGDNWYKFGRS